MRKGRVILSEQMELKWLAMVLVAFLLGGWSDGCWEQEKIALFQLNPFFYSIDGPDNWMEGKESSDCCKWERVECNTTTKRVIHLFLNLTGTIILDGPVYSTRKTDYYSWRSEREYAVIPDGWSNRDYWYLNASLFLPFEELQSLYLSGNSIAGCVANEGFEKLSSKLDKLEILDLSNNYFNDSILASLSELSSLKFLNLAANQFTSSNPTHGIKMLSKLNNLETLGLRGNILGNNILSHLDGFTSLKSLYLQGCGLEGTVDMLELNNLMNLRELYLGDNRIKSLGSLFQEKEQLRLTKLEVLGLSYNLFNNSILSSLGALSNLKSLYLDANHLKGAIYIKDLNVLSNLEELTLSYNEVNEFVPSKGLRLMKLEVLNLGGNLFNNSIFSSFGALSNLKSLYLYSNNLKGPIHIEDLNALSNLEKLTLSDNKVNEFVPSKELRLMKLEVLNLGENLFNNSIFLSFGAFSNLKSLYLHSNNLKGPINIEDLNALSNLEELSLENNEVNGFIPSKELRLMKLEVLNLRWNRFNNSIFSSFGALSNLKSLYLHSNNLKGPIHIEDLNALSNLEELSLGNNEVNGFIPSKAKLRLMNLEVLDVSWNLFNGSILSSLARLSNLKSLDLGGIKFKGSMNIRELDGLSNLEELYIGCNVEYPFFKDINCSLPLQSLGLFLSLKTLSLVGFNLTGGIMTSRSQNRQNLTSLEKLTMESSSLHSNFMRTLTSLKSLTMWDSEINGNFFLHDLVQLRNLESMHIFGTSLENNFLQKIGAMPSIKYLSLVDCGLNGTLHTQGFCGLANLRELFMGYNNLGANLPECLSNFTSLEKLVLYSNQFSGDVSVLKSLTSLERLDVSSNQLSGNVSALKSLTSLKVLSLSNNYFQIPSSLEPFFNLSKLKVVEADNNTIYADGNMQSLVPRFQLEEISLSCCGDVGPFPQFLYHQRDLQYVDLSNINLKGKFPNWLLQNNTGLQTLVLANNSLMGHFELSFFSHMDLSYLDISKNFFYGSIPIEIGVKLPSLGFLNMSKNNFGGSIPASIGDMNSLYSLDISDNRLSGELPEQLAMSCFSLNSLSLSNNGLQGQIFSSNFNLTNLYELHLDGNNFSGRIPQSLSNCSYLSTLDVSNNKLVGGIPSWMKSMSWLSTLDLSKNELSGGIPRWMGNMSSLEEIVLANNHLEGPIPVEFCHLNLNLKLLDLSMNNISGRLPPCFSPLWISQVHLSRNKLEGPLASVFRNSTILVTLDLSNNHLTGKIPDWIGKLSQLSYLLLNNNHFEGEISTQLCNLHHLSLIDFSNNNLSGTIPSCLKITTLNEVSQDYVRYVAAVAQAPSSFSTEEPIEFTSKNMSYSYKGKILTYLSGIDLSCNKLTGEIPHQVKNFRNIYALNLSHNRLTGSIPLAFSDLKQVESLDLSYNNLSGKIPPQLVGLYSLSYFNVAYNNLSGITPQWTAQFATFGESSYVGNPLLCGAPLPKNCSTSGPSSSILPKASTDNGPIDMNVFYVCFVVSYVIALLTIASVLYINPYWRRAWFYHIEVVSNSCYYFIEDYVLPKRFHCGNM